MANGRMHKKTSKRMTTRKRCKIEKKVRQHNRKLKKGATQTAHRRSRKDPGIPNSYPGKADLLKEVEDAKKRLELERQKAKERRKEERQKVMNKARNLTDLVVDADKRSLAFDRKKSFIAEKSSSFGGQKSAESSLKAYYKEFSKVVENGDVILQVLDARDPLGSRCPQVEQAVLAAGTSKKLVLLLNKIDLVPKENVESWLKYLRNEFPTIAFKASTQNQSTNLCQSRVPLSQASDDLRKSSQCLGADVLMKLIGNYCRKKDLRTAITVGVVGFPNTGKSSIINSLKRCKACNVGATPGVTKLMQTVQLDKHVKLLDSPGIVMATGDTIAATILKNCVKVETVEDPVVPVEAIMSRFPKQQMREHYRVGDFSNVTEFLSLLAVRMGRLKKGGIPDVNRAGKAVIQDWNSGKIRYHTEPPETFQMSSHLDAQIVSQMSAEFDIDALLQDEATTLQDLKAGSKKDIVLMSDGLTAGVEEVEECTMESDDDDDYEDVDDDEEEMIEESEQKPTKMSVTFAPKKAEASNPKNKPKAEKVLAGNQQLNRKKKKEYKKMRKDKKKLAKLSSAMDTGEDYNFKEYF